VRSEAPAVTPSSCYLCRNVAAEPTLTALQLNRALLARQFLLERSSLSMVETVERIGGLQTQYAPSGYIGLWSRLQNFRREALTTALEQRRVIQGSLLRSTIHMVSARDYPYFLAAVKPARQEWWRRTRKEFGTIDMEVAITTFRDHLRGGPRPAGELKALLAAHGYPALAWNGVAQWVDMVRVPPSGTWDQRRADLYGLADDWVGSSKVSEAAGLEHVVRRYLGGFGPATVREIAEWAGVPPPRIGAILGRLSLRRFRDEKGRELVDLPRAPLPEASTPAPVRFLPTWDATLLVHARRTQILPERYRPLVFNTKTPHSKPTLLIDGAIAGTWRYEGGRVQVEPFEPLPRRVRAEVNDEAQRLAAFHTD